MSTIPKQLQDAAFRFILIREKEKVPLEKWAEPKYQYSYDAPEIKAHLSKRGNLGIVSGYGDLIVIDCDVGAHIEIFEAIREVAPKTFSVQSARGFHLYYRAPFLVKRHTIEKFVLPDIGQVEFRCAKCFTLCPPSVHPSGIAYTVLEDKPVSELSEQDYAAIISAILPYTQEAKEAERGASAVAAPEQQQLLQKVLAKMDCTDRGSYYLCRCPFHQPDRHPSAALYKNTLLFCDFHDGQIFNIKRLGKELGVLSEQEPLAIVEAPDGSKIYKLLSENGIYLPAHGWYYSSGTFASFAQPLSCFTQVIPADPKEKPYERVEHFIAEGIYKNGELCEMRLHPISGTRTIELNGVIACLENKTMITDTLPTSMPFRVYDALKKGEEWNVSLSDLFERLHKKFEQYIDLPEPELSLIVCWVMGTYFADVFYTYPSLFATGSLGSGKSRLIYAISAAARRGYPVVNPSDANFYRIVDSWAPSLAIDDFDTIFREHREIVSSLLKFAYKSLAKVPRLRPLRNGGYVVEMFRVFCPLALSACEDFESQQLLSRLIQITMKKSKKNLPNEPAPADFSEERAQLYYLSYKLAPKMESEFKSLSLPFIGRPREVWTPILLIAKHVSSELYESLLDYALKKVKEQTEKAYYNERYACLALLELYRSGVWEHSSEGVIIRFTIPVFREAFKSVLCNAGELTEQEFERYWSHRRCGRLLAAMGLKVVLSGQKRERTRILKYSELLEMLDRYEVDAEGVSVMSVKSVNMEDTPPYTPLKNEDFPPKKPLLNEGMEG